jgi:hypothetical protein
MPGAVLKVPDSFSLVSDAFSGTISKAAANSAAGDIRRPLVGTQRKVDSYASIRILAANGNSAKIYNSSARSPDSNGTYYNFMLQSYEEQRMEKSQIIETFGQSYVYFFGERTPSIRFSGVLMDTADFNWKSEFLHNYEKFFRGTNLIKNNTRAYVRVGDHLFGGYLTDVQVSSSATEPEQAPFSFGLIVTDRALVSYASANVTDAASFGRPINIPYAPRYNTPGEKASPTNLLDKIRDGYRSVSGSLREGVDSVVGLLRALSSGRVVSVPDIILPAYSNELQVRTTEVSLVNGTVDKQIIFDGKPIKITPLAIDIPAYKPEFTGKVTDNSDEYIQATTEKSIQDTEALFKKLSDVGVKSANGIKLRDFLKKNGMAEYKVDGLSATARLAGRVGFGLLNSFSSIPLNAIRRS